MGRQCEACSALELSGHKPLRTTRIRTLLVADRLFCFCDTHADVVRDAAPKSIEDIRDLLKEPDGLRSLMARRSDVNRRIFPPRPEGRRRSQARRSSDR
jgi:hypothetical protein